MSMYIQPAKASRDAYWQPCRHNKSSNTLQNLRCSLGIRQRAQSAVCTTLRQALLVRSSRTCPDSRTGPLKKSATSLSIHAPRNRIDRRDRAVVERLRRRSTSPERSRWCTHPPTVEGKHLSSACAATISCWAGTHVGYEVLACNAVAR